MKRSLFFSWIAVTAALRVKAQEAIYDASSDVKFGRSSGAKDKGTLDGSGKLYKIAIGIFHGKIKAGDRRGNRHRKPINQTVSIRRSRRTKFLRNNEPVHP